MVAITTTLWLERGLIIMLPIVNVRIDACAELFLLIAYYRIGCIEL